MKYKCNDDEDCPICGGTGKIEPPKHKDIDSVVLDTKRDMAKKLIDKGYSYRQIQKALGYKSVRSISYLLK